VWASPKWLYVTFVTGARNTANDGMRLLFRFRANPIYYGEGTTSVRMRRASKRSRFDVAGHLRGPIPGKEAIDFRPGQKIFTQGDPATTVYFIQQGAVKLSTVSKGGKEAMIGLLGSGEFFGEGCLTGQPRRLSTATAAGAISVLAIPKEQMARMLHEDHVFSDRFIAHMLKRNVRIEEDLVDQLFNSTEKRLARALLLLARYGREGRPETIIPRISQETLAGMVGTNRGRVNMFMNKFRKLGFIDYNGGLQVHSSLLTVVLND
jgi:CRP/FNR family cyclic AMP-dependent transcriptional regulator